MVMRKKGRKIILKGLIVRRPRNKKTITRSFFKSKVFGLKSYTKNQFARFNGLPVKVFFCKLTRVVLSGINFLKYNEFVRQRYQTVGDELRNKLSVARQTD